MKIVHEIHSSDVQIVLGPDVYVSAAGRPHRMKLTVCATVPLPPGGESEVLHFEGDGGCIASVLRQIVELIEDAGRREVELGHLDAGWDVPNG